MPRTCAPGTKMGDMSFIDTMIRDGLWDAFNGYHMGQTAENVAASGRSPATMQDEFAVASQNKAEAAQKAGPLRRRDRGLHDQDPQGRHGRRSGRIHPPRRHDRRDGQAAPGLRQGRHGHRRQRERPERRRGRRPADVGRGGREARDRAAGADRLYATAGLDPSIMGVGPIHASRKALEKAGWKVEDLDLVEANEAFAAQACAVNKDMGWDPAIVNVNGGAIAIGHPIGASGARVLNTLLFEMKRRGAKKGLATLCIGGGMGVALCVERPEAEQARGQDSRACANLAHRGPWSA
jgi:acetyl-CoA C-acetyltransferase